LVLGEAGPDAPERAAGPDTPRPARGDVMTDSVHRRFPLVSVPLVDKAAPVEMGHRPLIRGGATIR
jgi:hypothetical protein